VIWERLAPKVPDQSHRQTQQPGVAESRPSSANGIYVFFPDYGLIAYDGSGRQRWTMPLGPSRTSTGWALAGHRRRSWSCWSATRASVVHHGRGQAERTVSWRSIGPKAKSGHSTPSRLAGPTARDQIVVPGRSC
jgi:hypothetical protein